MANSPYCSASLVLITFLLIMFTGCSASEPVSEQAEQQRDLSELEELYWNRIESSRMSFTQADVDFMTGMIAHHAQALIMSRLAPENNAGRSVQILASRIINAQSDEINLMQNWLRNRNQPVPEIHIDGINLVIQLPEDDHQAHHGHNHHAASGHDHHNMPGMLTQEQLEELAAAKESEFDRKFLEFMIEHHMGAVVMVEDLFASEGAALDNEIFDLASGINAEQITEIERMKLMLESIE